MSCSSLWVYSGLMGSSSAVGIAVRNESRTSSLYSVLLNFKYPDRSFFDMPPIGQISAEEQSYLHRNQPSSHQIIYQTIDWVK